MSPKIATPQATSSPPIPLSQQHLLFLCLDTFSFPVSPTQYHDSVTLTVYRSIRLPKCCVLYRILREPSQSKTPRITMEICPFWHPFSKPTLTKIIWKERISSQVEYVRLESVGSPFPLTAVDVTFSTLHVLQNDRRTKWMFVTYKLHWGFHRKQTFQLLHHKDSCAQITLYKMKIRSQI